MKSLACVLTLVACGPKPASQDPLPTLEPDEGKTTLPVPQDQHIEAKGPLRDGPPGILLGVRMHVVDTTLLLFDDEQLEASNMIAKALRQAGLTVEDPKRTREIYQRAAHGQHVTTGQACGAGLDATSAAKRWGVEIGTKHRIETAVYCEEKCWIEVNLAEGIDQTLPPHPKRKAHYAAPYDIGQPWRTELPKRLGELVAFRSLRDFGPAKYVPGSVPPAAKPDVAYEDTNDKFDVPAALAPATKKCIGTKGAAGVVVETDATDKVTKCEWYARAFDGNADVAPCVCGALTGKSLEGKGPRRAAIFTRGVDFKIRTDGGHELNVQGSWDQVIDETDKLWKVRVSDPSISGWDLPSFIELEACFLSMGEGFIGADVEVTFDQVGKATGAKLTKTDGPMTPAMQKCVHDAFMTSKASCPAVPTSTGYGRVSATATKL